MKKKVLAIMLSLVMVYLSGLWQRRKRRGYGRKLCAGMEVL